VATHNKEHRLYRISSEKQANDNYNKQQPSGGGKSDFQNCHIILL
jgi:hypothetical protein